MENERLESENLRARLCGMAFGWQAVPETTLAALCEAARLVHSLPRRALFRRGDAGTGLYVVRTGQYKLSMISPEGREQIVFLADPGKIITEALVEPGGHCRLSCFANVDSSAWWIPEDVLMQALSSDGSVASAIATTMAYRQGRMLDLIYDLSLRSVEQRLAAFLLLLARRDNKVSVTRGHEIRRALPVQMVAGLLGTTREEVTRAQAKLQRSGIIAVTRRHVRILEPDLLEAAAQ